MSEKMFDGSSFFSCGVSLSVRKGALAVILMSVSLWPRVRAGGDVLLSGEPLLVCLVPVPCYLKRLQRLRAGLSCMRRLRTEERLCCDTFVSLRRREFLESWRSGASLGEDIFSLPSINLI